MTTYDAIFIVHLFIDLILVAVAYWCGFRSGSKRRKLGNRLPQYILPRRQHTTTSYIRDRHIIEGDYNHYKPMKKATKRHTHAKRYK